MKVKRVGKTIVECGANVYVIIDNVCAGALSRCFDRRRGAFSFDTEAEPHAMEVDFRWWGYEAYLLDGQLLHSRWNLSFSGKQEFDISGRKVRIEVSGYPKTSNRVFVDDNLHVEDLFPEEKAKADKWNRAPHKYWRLFAFALWLSLVSYGVVDLIDDAVNSYQEHEPEAPAGCRYVRCSA